MLRTIVKVFLGVLILMAVCCQLADAQKAQRSGRKTGERKKPKQEQLAKMLKELRGSYSGEPGATERIREKTVEDVLWKEIDSVEGEKIKDPVGFLKENAEKNEQIRAMTIRVHADGSMTFANKKIPNIKYSISMLKPVNTHKIDRFDIIEVEVTVQFFSKGKKAAKQKMRMKIGRSPDGSMFFNNTVFEKRKNWDLFEIKNRNENRQAAINSKNGKKKTAEKKNLNIKRK